MRTQVGNLDTFEIHISKLISKIPRDGSTIDVFKLLLMLIFDTTTEFLFGHSNDTLGTGSEKGVRFAEALPTPRQRWVCKVELASLHLYSRTRNTVMLKNS